MSERSQHGNILAGGTAGQSLEVGMSWKSTWEREEDSMSGVECGPEVCKAAGHDPQLVGKSLEDSERIPWFDLGLANSGCWVEVVWRG